MTVVWEGPSPWPVGKCAGCVMPVHPLALSVVVATEGGLVGTLYHRKCWAVLDKGEQTDDH